MTAKKWARKDPKEGSSAPTTTASGNNTVQATSSQKKKKTWDSFEVICYSCNKKGHYAKDYTKTKN